MNLEQSVVLVDRALVTLCAELPESLGLYNTAKDEFLIGAMRSIPMLEQLLPESRKHHIIRDWMRTYVEHEDQPLSADVVLAAMRETMKKERKQRAKEAKERNAELLSDDEDKPPKEKKLSKANGKAKAKAVNKEEAAAAAARRKAAAKIKRKKQREEEVPSDSDVSTSSTPSSDELDGVDDSSSSSSSSSGSSSSSDDDKPRRSKNKTRKKTTSTKSKGKEKRRSSSAKEKRPRRASGSNLPPLEVVLSSDEDDEPDELFDADDPDVYEVESILDKKPGRFGEPDKYLIKWVGYEETTWEPAENVSKDLIDEFEGQPVRENEYVVEEILDRKTVRDKQTNLKTFKYLVKWVGYDDTTWEPAENLPHNLRRKFDTKYEARKRRRTS